MPEHNERNSFHLSTGPPTKRARSTTAIQLSRAIVRLLPVALIRVPEVGSLLVGQVGQVRVLLSAGRGAVPVPEQVDQGDAQREGECAGKHAEHGGLGRHVAGGVLVPVGLGSHDLLLARLSAARRTFPAP